MFVVVTVKKILSIPYSSELLIWALVDMTRQYLPRACSRAVSEIFGAFASLIVHVPDPQHQ